MQIPSNTEDKSIDFTIKTLLENFNEKVVLPDFQRGYTWSEETVRSFMKSSVPHSSTKNNPVQRPHFRLWTGNSD